MIGNWRRRWIQAQESRWSAEYESTRQHWEDRIDKAQQDLDTQLAHLRRDQADVEDLLRRTQDRKVELQEAQEELKTQIRLVEAKARPDSIWVAAFTSGFQKAWETMASLQSTNLAQAQKAIRDQAIQETLSNLSTVIEEKARGDALRSG